MPSERSEPTKLRRREAIATHQKLTPPARETAFASVPLLRWVCVFAIRLSQPGHVAQLPLNALCVFCHRSAPFLQCETPEAAFLNRIVMNIDRCECEETELRIPAYQVAAVKILFVSISVVSPAYTFVLDSIPLACILFFLLPSFWRGRRGP
ncbi:hypothetical protein BD410DRAFT_21013 [Rickenella mellea]|uniref:Uncharacterized protein n=1 Tax=Rickenella mellea TaxID=50990 RepID=A0A4R5XFN1_9AGAM|nr:hypothetical protein BD410DRAFT_21013 [Rickenella mellea]